jgi:hypothetical protein
MDAQTRHQLKSQELQELLSNLEWLNSNRTRYTLAALLVVLVAVIAYKIVGWNRMRAHDAAWQELMAVQALSNDDISAQLNLLRSIAADTSYDDVQMWAQYRLGCALVRQANYDSAERDKLATQAVSELQGVLKTSNLPLDLEAAARYALATAYETKRDLDGARDSYSALSTDERFAPSAFSLLATQRLANLDDLSQPVVFAPGKPAPPKPPAPPATQESTSEAGPPAETPAQDKGAEAGDEARKPDQDKAADKTSDSAGGADGDAGGADDDSGGAADDSSGDGDSGSKEGAGGGDDGNGNG